MSIDVDEIENRVRRRLAVTQARGVSVVGNADKTSSERRLPSDGGPAVPKAAVDTKVIASACTGIAIFQNLRQEDRQRLYESMYQLEYQPGEDIVKQGEDGRNFYVVVEGSLAVTIKKDGSPDINKKLFPGDTFGEVALLHSVPRSATVSAGAEKAKVWALDRTTFKKILSEAAFKRRKANETLLAKVKLLEELDEYRRKVLADALVPCSFGKGEAIFTQGKPEGVKFHIIEKGEVSIKLSDGKEVNSLTVGGYFGEVSVLEGTAPTASVLATTDVQTISLDRAAFKRMLGDEIIAAMMEYMKDYTYDKATPSAQTAPTADAAGTKLRRSYFTGAMRAPKEAVASIKKGFRRLSLEGRDAIMVWKDDKGKATIRRKDLTFHKELGVGMSGNVYLAKVANTNTTCCVKVMQKMKLIRLDQVENIMRERELMQSFDTPFVMQSHCAFQDSGFLYLVMEYMAGGDLFQLLVNGTEKGLFAPPAARFYGAEVLLALEFLHKKNYIYRDLKPENILIASNGHIKLADLGFCKPLMPGDRTYTTCGTSDYMAPEVMLSQGYGKSADYWAFGVFIYEMLTGYAPFMGKSDSDRHRRILTADLRFRADFHLQAKDLVSKLCVVDLSHRYGMMSRGIDDIKDHPFFSQEYDWNMVANREITPPIFPKIRKAEDMIRETLKSVAKATDLDALSPEDDGMFAAY